MDDEEEEDMSQPTSQLWGASFGVKHDDRASQIAAGQAFAAFTAALFASHSRYSNRVNMLACVLQRQLRLPFYGYAGLQPHFPVQFEHMEDRGEIEVEQEEEEEEDDGRVEDNDRVVERLEQLRIEQIGRKLRAIGDSFQSEIAAGIARQPVWLRIMMALFGVARERRPRTRRRMIGAHR
ncbi:uncharacterized protein KZ484_014073 [Pholidichthys leucotaenia]